MRNGRVALMLGVACLLALQWRAAAQGQGISLMEHFRKKAEILPGVTYDVFRLDLDVTGDGVPELFLAHSGSAGTSGTEEWFAYQRAPDGRYRLLDTLAFSYLGFELTGDPLRFVAYYKGGEVGTGALATYRVDASGFQEESRRDGVPAGGTEWRDFDVWRKQVHLKVLAIDLRELETSADPVWTDLLNKNETVPGVSSLTGLVVVEP